MNIFVKSITDLNIPQPCHGKNLARLARECFTNRQVLTVDFDGVKMITSGFLQELFLPLVAEYGADFLHNNLQVINVSTAVDELMKSAFNPAALDDFFDQHMCIENKACDTEIYDLNLAWLIKARDLARDNSIFAELMMGISDEAMRLALSRLSIDDIQHIAQSGWLCFVPRFTTHFIHGITTQSHDVVDVLLGISGSLS